MIARKRSLPFLPSAHGRREARLLTEIALERCDLLVSEPEVLDVPERFAVLRPAEVLHERLVAVREHLLQLEPLDEPLLRRPALRLERALADVIVPRRAREREIVRQQGVERGPVRLLPRRVPAPEDLLVGRIPLGTGNEGRSSQRTCSRGE